MRSLPFSDRNLGQYLPYNTNRIKGQSQDAMIYYTAYHKKDGGNVPL
jgi:hypothetical protein